MLNQHNPDSLTNFKILESKVDVEIFDPPMCCPTGICGPNIDQMLLDVNEMIQGLKDRGYMVERYQMTSHPSKFTENPSVMALIREKQMQALPIIISQGKIIAVGSYPTFDEISEILKEDK